MKLNVSAASIFALVGIALASQPALSQGAIGKGPAPAGPAMAPQPRIAPAAPTPQAPRAPALIPSPSVGLGPQGIPTASPTGDPSDSSRHDNAISADQNPVTKKSVYYGNVYGDAVNDAKTATGGRKQEPSKAPLPSGYAYGPDGRIAYVGTDANGKTGTPAPSTVAIVGGSAAASKTGGPAFTFDGGQLRAEEPIPGVDVVVRKKPSGALATVHSDGRGNFNFGRLAPGDYEFMISGKQIESGIDKLLASQTVGGKTEPNQIIAVLVALLLPATHPAGGAPSSTRIERSFAPGSANNGLRISFTVPKDGAVPAVDWGDGAPASIVARDGRSVADNSGGSYGLALKCSNGEHIKSGR